MFRFPSGIVCLLMASMTFADDPAKPTTSTVEPAMIQSAEEKYSSEVAKAEALVAKAEAELAKARKTAGDARLKAYKDRLAEVTKTGDFDKAIAVKARIEQLEKEPESKSTKRPRPKDTVRFQGHAYALVNEPVTWHVAKQRCEEMGGHLACIHGVKEEEFVGHLCGKNSAWVGATDEVEENKWINVDGTVPVFAHVLLDNAAVGEHWMTWDGISQHFNDLNAARRLAYVCEWDR